MDLKTLATRISNLRNGNGRMVTLEELVVLFDAAGTSLTAVTTRARSRKVALAAEAADKSREATDKATAANKAFTDELARITSEKDQRLADANALRIQAETARSHSEHINTILASIDGEVADPVSATTNGHN